jgi:CheY-like chemotaxis protein
VQIPLTGETHLLQKNGLAMKPTKYILVVDDEILITLLLQDILDERFGCQVITTTSSEQALHLCEEFSFDLLITDYRMPELDGLALAQQVRQRYPHINILMMTAHNSEWLRQQTAKTGVAQIINKPVKPPEIRRVVTEVLNLADYISDTQRNINDTQ